MNVMVIEAEGWRAEVAPILGGNFIQSEGLVCNRR